MTDGRVLDDAYALITRAVELKIPGEQIASALTEALAYTLALHRVPLDHAQIDQLPRYMREAMTRYAQKL